MSKQMEAQLRQAKTARAALQDEVVRLKRELNEAQASGVPAGWKRVPVELTDAMAEASGCDGHFKLSAYEHAQQVWDDMLAAAPEPPCASPVVSSAGIEEACQRYTEMLLGKYPMMVVEQADTSRSGLPPRWHILQMLKKIPTLSPSKAHRWLGFVQCALVSHGLTNIDAEREATRGMFDDGDPCASPEIDNAVCESEGAESERQTERDEGDIFDRVQEVIAAVYDREMQIEDAAREVIDLCDGTITAKQETSHDNK